MQTCRSDIIMAYMKSNDFQVADVVFASGPTEVPFRYVIYSRGRQEKGHNCFYQTKYKSTIETQIDLAVEQPFDYKPTILNKAAGCGSPKV